MSTQVTEQDGAEELGLRDDPATPEPIMRIASGFMAAKHLFAANELGIFEALADGPTTVEGLAPMFHVPAGTCSRIRRRTLLEVQDVGVHDHTGTNRRVHREGEG